MLKVGRNIYKRLRTGRRAGLDPGFHPVTGRVSDLLCGIEGLSSPLWVCSERQTGEIHPLLSEMSVPKGLSSVCMSVGPGNSSLC